MKKIKHNIHFIHYFLPNPLKPQNCFHCILFYVSLFLSVFLLILFFAMSRFGVTFRDLLLVIVTFSHSFFSPSPSFPSLFYPIAPPPLLVVLEFYVLFLATNPFASVNPPCPVHFLLHFFLVCSSSVISPLVLSTSSLLSGFCLFS